MDGNENGAPFFFATEKPPTATAIDDDIYLTVTTAMPDAPAKVEAIDIILSLEYARRTMTALSIAIEGARRNRAG